MRKIGVQGALRNTTCPPSGLERSRGPADACACRRRAVRRISLWPIFARSCSKNSTVGTTRRPPSIVTFAPSNTSPGISTVRLNSWARNTSASTKPHCLRSEVGAEYGEPAVGGPALLLHPDTQAGVERGRNSLSQESAEAADHSQSRGGRSSDQRGPDSLSSHRIDDALCYRCAACRTGAPEDQRY